ncbi:MAG: phenylalanine--tRNA ligase beta subunit [Candidatus Binatia bacterium]|nr:MAG: phenylalanine--tRNA ligase beta subunit [Candidatus Binatia bacterium]
MRVSWNWLQEFVEVSEPVEAVAERLTQAGLEVESIEVFGQGLEHVVAGEVVSVTHLPDTPGFVACEVLAGGDLPPVAVITPFPVRAGQRVAVALLGAKLPSGDEVRLVEVSGRRSEARICTEADLRLGSNSNEPFWLPVEVSTGTPISVALGLKDTILEVAVTPNRGDCLSILGIAREVAALTGQRLRRPRIRVAERLGPTAEFVRVNIAPDAACHRYVARVFTDVHVGASPLWMQYRLKAVGLRPVNNIVDVTNYVMWERGQPLHAFDYDRLPAREITVRHASQREEFVTLDGETRVVEPGDLLITSGEKPVALAGIIGGANTEVSEATRRVLLESAWFSPRTVRRTAKRLGLKTEASYRFERGVDIEGVSVAADRAGALLGELCGARASSGRVDEYPRPHVPAPLAVRLAKVEELLGVSVGRQEMVGALRSLGFDTSPAPRGTVTVTPPSYRQDVEREIDVVEEVARLLGYDRLPATMPRSTLGGKGLGPLERAARNVRRLLVGLGLHEAIPLAFASAQENQDFAGIVSGRLPVRLRNPLSREDAEMRLSLVSGLVRAARHNLAQGAEAVALFVVGKVFWRDEQGPYRERLHIGGLVCPRFPEHGIGWRRKVTEFADIKGVMDTLLEFAAAPLPRYERAEGLSSFHPGKVAYVNVEGERLAVLGALHPKIERRYELASPCWVFELDLETCLQYRRARFSASELPRFPAVKRDLAIVVEEGFPAGAVLDLIRQWEAGTCIVEAVELVDEYIGPPIPAGHKSLTYSVWYRSPGRTLTDPEVNDVHTRLMEALVDRLGVRPR